MEITAVIVDDDAKHQKLLKEYLEEFGFRVFSLLDGNAVLGTIQKESPDIVILDIILPGRDGFEILKEIRQSSAVPVIMLSAKGDDTDRIVGLELGADDYLPKPFNPRELLARMKAVLRRHRSGDDTPEQIVSESALRSGGLVLDRSRQVLSCGENRVELSSTEYKLLVAMMERPGKVFSRDELMDQASGGEVIAFDRSIDVHVSRLRAKIEQVSGDRDKIRTVRGAGYKFAEEE
jgi:two-component system phosphate regulon response regulator OmpR